MSNYLVKDTALSYEAARIRAKTGSAAQITFDGDKGFGDAIDAIPSGGGGAQYTEISAVSILNDATHGYKNCVHLYPIGSIGQFDILYKNITDGNNDVNNIVLVAVSIPGLGPKAPFASYRNLSGTTLQTKEQIDGYAHIVGTISSPISADLVGIGAWNDSTFSKTNAFKYVKLYDSDGELIYNLIPVLDNNGRPCFFDTVNQSFYYDYSGVEMVAGEAIV